MKLRVISAVIFTSCMLILGCGRDSSVTKKKMNRINVIIPEYSRTKAGERLLTDPSMKVGDAVTVYVKELNEAFLFRVVESGRNASVLERAGFELREDQSYMIVYPVLKNVSDNRNLVIAGFGVYSHTYDYFFSNFKSLTPKVITDTLSISDVRNYGVDPEASIDTIIRTCPGTSDIPLQQTDTLLLVTHQPKLYLDYERDDVGLNIELSRWNGIVTLDMVSPFEGNVAEISIYDPSECSFCMKGVFKPVGTTIIPCATTWFNHWFFPIYDKTLRKGGRYSFVTTIFPWDFSGKNLTLFVRMEDGRVACMPVSLPHIRNGQLVKLSAKDFEILDKSYVMPSIFIGEKDYDKFMYEPQEEYERRDWCFDNWDI